jgi:hypothetical protein
MNNYDGGAYERKWGKMVTLTGKAREAHIKWHAENHYGPDHPDWDDRDGCDGKQERDEEDFYE